ncbi:hypothetical protein RHMOL_Rhmol10G0051800 [Rhododendron molle]|uniref:Uncharacterized protein n=1 Tax=Rhododendron molle TaxID=49168 RepID=A0ACC0LZ31_RHOML|nr:hypothetical protein RHMOL_Rhmol10G0051800 [Rhododendron molle]
MTCFVALSFRNDLHKACWICFCHGDTLALSGERLQDTKQEDGSQPITAEEITVSNATEVVNENPMTPSFDNEAATTKTSKTEEEHSDTSDSQDKTLKKPDKILPCPRCNSMDTKFCYYNNYNVNQPRHFCKNCQRYWTAGGDNEERSSGRWSSEEQELSFSLSPHHCVGGSSECSSGSSQWDPPPHSKAQWHRPHVWHGLSSL